MMDNEINNGFDWYKNKVVNVRQRGTLALVATAMVKDGRLVNSESSKQRYIWPSAIANNDTKILSRRVWSKGA